MSILLALIPPLAWGATGIIGTKMGGSAAQQTFGESCGALLLGIGVYLFFVMPNGVEVTGRIWLVGLFSGLFWSVGTAGQFIAYKKMGVSAASHSRRWANHCQRPSRSCNSQRMDHH